MSTYQHDGLTLHYEDRGVWSSGALCARCDGSRRLRMVQGG